MSGTHLIVLTVIITSATIWSAALGSTNSSCSIHSNVGRDFYFGLPTLFVYSSSYYSYQKHIIYIASSNPGRVVIDAPASGIHTVLHVQEGGTEFEIPYTSVHYTNATVKNNGIRLQSDVDISVSLFTAPGNGYQLPGTASFLVLPTAALSTDYTVATFDYGSTSYPNSFLIVATENNTTVSLTFPDIDGHRFLVKNQFQVAMNYLDAYFFSNSYDLSNVRVHSNYPVAVIGSSTLSRIPRYLGNGDSVAEFIPPNTFGGYNFIVPALTKRSHYIVRVFAVEDSTSVSFRNYSSLFRTSVYKDLYDEYLFGDDAVIIQADKPIMVYQYATAYGYISENVGAFMRSIPAIENYVTDANFVIQDQIPEINNYVQIIFPHSSVVLMDNLAVGLNIAGGHVMHDYTVNGQRYSVVSFSVPESADVVHGVKGYHRVQSQYGNVRFAVLLSGYNTDRREAYGLSLGLQSPGCHAGPGGTIPATIAPSNGTSHTGTNGTKTGVFCLQCDDMSHLFLCDTITRCSSSEVCYVERYTIANSEVRYRSGCKYESQCAYRKRGTDQEASEKGVASSRQTRATTCLECCGGDFCNHKGCGGEELPLANRGPFCLSCQHVLGINECKTVSICQSNEVCSIEVNDFGIYSQYKMGCKPAQTCPSRRRRRVGRRDKRSNTVCSQCCSHDFCNFACTSGPTGISTIIG